MKSSVLSLNITYAHSLVNLGKKQRAVSENVHFVLCGGFSQSRPVILSCKKVILFCKAESCSELFITMLKSVTYCVLRYHAKEQDMTLFFGHCLWQHSVLSLDKGKRGQIPLFSFLIYHSTHTWCFLWFFPRCLHEWKPHDGRPLSCLLFCDNHKKQDPE